MATWCSGGAGTRRDGRLGTGARPRAGRSGGRQGHADRLWCGVLLHAAAGAVGVLGAAALGLSDVFNPDSAVSLSVAAACACVPALFGALRWSLLTLPAGGWQPVFREGRTGHG